MTALAFFKVITENTWIEVTDSSQKKANTRPKFYSEKRRILFCQEDLSPQKSKVNLMFALNKAL